MSKFKGYAQSSGFRNIQLPDTSKKILEEGNLTISRMNEVQRIERENAETYIRALQDKYRIEEANRDSIFQLESENLETVRSAMVKNADTINNNARIEASRSKETFEALASFSQTAGEVAQKIGKQIYDNQVKSGELFASELAMYGISMAEAEYVKSIDTAFVQNDAKFKAIEDKLLAAGASNDVIQRIRNMNSSTLYGLKKTMLVNGAEEYAALAPQWEAADLFDETGKSLGISLGQARLGNQFKDLVDAQDARNKSRFITDYGGADDKMVKAYLYPGIESYDRQVQRSRSVDIADNLRKERQLNEAQEIRTAYKHRGLSGVWNLIQQHPLHKDKRIQVLSTFTDMAKAGTLGDGTPDGQLTVYEQLLDMDVSLTPGGPKQKFGALYGNDLVELRDAVMTRYRADVKENTFLRQQHIAKVADETYDYFLKNRGNFQKSVLTEAINQLKFNGADVSKLLTLTNSSLDYKYVLEERTRLQALADQAILTSSDLAGADAENIKLFEPQVKEWEAMLGSLPQTEAQVKAILTAGLRNVLGADDLTKGSSDTLGMAVSHAVSIYRSRLKNNLADGSSTLSSKFGATAHSEALEYVRKQIKNSKESDSPFFVRSAFSDDGESAGKSYFARFEIGDDLYVAPQVTTLTQDFRVRITKDPELLRKSHVISSAYASQIAQQIKNGKPLILPPYIHELTLNTKIPPHEIINQQLELKGYKERAVSGAIQNLKDSDEVREHPELVNILNQPSLSNINNVANSVGHKVRSVRIGGEGYNDIVSLGQQAGFKAPNVMAAMWANETGYGKYMSGRNNLFNIKSTDGTGPKTTTKEFRADGTSYYTTARWRTYEAPSQSVDDFIKFISKYPGVKEAETPNQMLQALYDNGYATSPTYVEDVSRVMTGYGINPDAPFIKYSGPPTRDPNLSSSTLQHAYTVSGIGWGSTGSHLDQKQEDNPNTPENEKGQYYHYKDPELMEYIFADDPELGMIPIGDSPMTGSWESHTKRGSNGYDYGFYDGTKIFIKPPARVVSSFRTSEGDDMMIIELPSGRRFKWHHGRSS